MFVPYMVELGVQLAVNIYTRPVCPQHCILNQHCKTEPNIFNNYFEQKAVEKLKLYIC
jgi:hypothetical protein